MIDEQLGVLVAVLVIANGAAFSTPQIMNVTLRAMLKIHALQLPSPR
jgi:hypothetical protein